MMLHITIIAQNCTTDDNTKVVTYFR